MHLIVDLNRTKYVAECSLITTPFVFRRHSYHVEQLAVPELGSYHGYEFRLPRRLINVAQGSSQAAATSNRSALESTALAQVSLALTQAVEKLLRCLLQVLTLGLCHAEVYSVCVNNLILILAIATLRGEPNTIVAAQLAPVARHARSHNAAKCRICLVT